LLDVPVSTYLPEFSGGNKDRVTLRMLLEHGSGLPAGRDIWRMASTPAEARAVVISSNLACEPGRCYEYSDLGADILGFVVENVSGQRLDQFLAERVWAPLGMTDTFFLPADSLRTRVAPTETSPPRATRSAAKCTMRTHSRWAASLVTPDSSARRRISPSSRR